MKRYMESRQYFNKNYAIEEDEFCHWWLYKNGYRFANSKTPYPLIEEALKQDWITLQEATEVASNLNLKLKFIKVKW